MYRFADFARETKNHPAVKLAIATLAILAIIALSALGPWPASMHDRAAAQDSQQAAQQAADTATAWSFWSNDPSMAETRNYVASHHENVGFVKMINAPETANLDSLVPDGPDVAVYDVDQHEWIVYAITQD